MVVTGADTVMPAVQGLTGDLIPFNIQEMFGEQNISISGASLGDPVRDVSIIPDAATGNPRLISGGRELAVLVPTGAVGGYYFVASGTSDLAEFGDADADLPGYQGDFVLTLEAVRDNGVVEFPKLEVRVVGLHSFTGPDSVPSAAASRSPCCGPSTD